MTLSLLKLLDKVEFYYEHRSTDHPLLGGDFPQNVCQMPGISGKIDHGDWWIDFIIIIFLCIYIYILKNI
jgi:hypothetical protein